MTRHAIRLATYGAILLGATLQLALMHTDPVTWSSYVDLGCIIVMIGVIVRELLSPAAAAR